MSRFQTTHWSLIAAARDHPSQARDALEQLCRAYRPPVLAFVRHCGHPPSDAEDLTQAFFLRFIERGGYGEADPRRGRFRSLLLTALRRFLIDQRDAEHAARRDSARTVELDDFMQPRDESDSPERAFTRVWMGTVIGNAFARLQAEWERAGKREQFTQLSALLTERADSTELHALADRLGMRPNTLSVQAHRMRQRLRQLVRLEVLQTVGSSEALELELAELRSSVPDAP